MQIYIKLFLHISVLKHQFREFTVVLARVMNYEMIKYNIVMCYDKILVSLAAYAIPGEVCVW